jgi:hypothetical protein
VDAFNSLITDRDSIFAAYRDIIADFLTDNTALEKEAQAIQGECDVVLEQSYHIQLMTEIKHIQMLDIYLINAIIIKTREYQNTMKEKVSCFVCPTESPQKLRGDGKAIG